MLNRAYSLLTQKAASEDENYVYIEGIASTPSVDRAGDVVEPLGARFKTPMPLMMHHDPTLPVGNMTFARATAAGIPFKARLPRVVEEGVVRNRVNEAIHSLKYDLISGVSIGFKPVAGQIERLKSGGLRFKEWEWFELSLVTIPANADASITTIKSLDNVLLAATGRKQDRVVRLLPPGVSGQPEARKGVVFLK